MTGLIRYMALFGTITSIWCYSHVRLKWDYSCCHILFNFYISKCFWLLYLILKFLHSCLIRSFANCTHDVTFLFSNWSFLVSPSAYPHKCHSSSVLIHFSTDENSSDSFIGSRDVPELYLLIIGIWDVITEIMARSDVG